MGNECVGIALVGFGTVGSTVTDILLREHELLAQRGGLRYEIRSIIDRDPESIVLPASGSIRKSATPDLALDDPEVSIIVELTGEVEAARRLCERAFDAGKHVVTANKALLAEHGSDLLRRARANGVTIGFEASCGGGIPIVRALYDGLVANRIEALYGIVNGTCNFILTEMIEKRQPYEEALHSAQAQGIAESNPKLDVGGIDSAHKIALLASLAFGVRVRWSDIPVSGIENLRLFDIDYGEKLGYVIKLLAIAVRDGKDRVSVRVHPCFIMRSHPLAWVVGSFNAISVYGYPTGHTLYYGRGAGAAPTASAVIADIVGISSGEISAVFDRFSHWPDRTATTTLLPVGEFTSRFYLCTMIGDVPGGLAQMASILAKAGINIAAVYQTEQIPASPTAVPVVAILHPTKEADVRQAVREIDSLPSTASPTTIIPIVDEYQP